MKTLTKKLSATLFVLFVLLNNIQAQSALETAFTRSYEFEAAGKYGDAINTLKTQYDVKSYETNLRLGYLNYLLKLYNESEAYYAKAIAIMPFSVEAKLGLVYPLAAANNWVKVVSTYKEILAIDPQNSTVNYRMGLISYNAKDYKTAYNYLEKVVNLYPFSYDGLILFAWANLNIGKYKEAYTLFNRVLLLSPADKSAKEGLALIK